MINSKIYEIAGDVEIIDINSTSCRTISLDELIKSKVLGVTLYSMQDNSDNAVIRVVTVSLK